MTIVNKTERRRRLRHAEGVEAQRRAAKAKQLTSSRPQATTGTSKNGKKSD